MSSIRSNSLSSIRRPRMLCASIPRRDWLISATASISAIALPFEKLISAADISTANIAVGKPKFGLVTYLWGKDMDLATVIKACQHAGMGGVELRTEHKHAVEPSLSVEERKAIKKHFEVSGIELIGYGANCEFHSPKPEVLAANIELCKKYIQYLLCSKAIYQT